MVQDAKTYEGTEPYIYDLPTKKYYAFNSDGKYEEYGIVVNVDDLNSTTTYEGKLAILSTDNHEYKFTSGSWTDLGSAAGQPIADTSYQNLNNWNCRFGYDSTFGTRDGVAQIAYDAENGTNYFADYQGSAFWEPYQCKVNGLTAGDTYKLTFKFSTSGWSSWSSYTVLPFYVFDTEDFGREEVSSTVGGSILGYVGLPNSATSNQEYTIQFSPNSDFAVLAIQFGVVDDGSHNPAFTFNFDNLKVERIGLPETYTATLEAVAPNDPNAYTPLEYIEAVSQACENTFTLPYIPTTPTKIAAQFLLNDKSSGWCGIFSARNVYAGTGISLYMNGDRAHFGYFTGGTTGSGDTFADFSLNTEYTVEADVTNLKINGTDKTTGNSVTNPTSRRLSLFANPERDNPMRGYYKYCTISEDGVTIMDFKPVMRHDGAFGFYDEITHSFVIPAQGKFDGYSYKKIDGKAYITYAADTRIVIVGNTAQFLPTVENLSDVTFTWSSADESIATVAEDGTVTGKKAGKVMITAATDADQGWTATYELTVAEPNYVRHDANGVGYAIVTGGKGWDDSPVAGLLDNDARTKFGCSDGSDAWAIMIASEPVAVKQYSFVTGGDTYDYPARNPRAWKLEGSNDNQNWTVIDEHNDYDAYKIHSVNKEEFTFAVNGAESYKFFKFTATALGAGIQIGEFWINEQAHTWGEPTVTAATCTVVGKSVVECADCHVLKTEVLPLAAHTYANGVCTECGAKISKPVLLANGQTNAYNIKFRHEAGTRDGYSDIEAGWNTAEFDDSAWDELVMPIGSDDYDGAAHKAESAQYNTIWYNEYNTYWFRRTFEVADPSVISKLTLKALHDDDYAVFVNGTKVVEATGWTNGTGWAVTDVDPTLLVAGKNVVAMYIEQNFGGAYADFSLEAEVAAPVTVSDAKYATFVAPFDVDASAVTTYAVTGVTDGWVTLTEIEAKNVPAGAAVVIGAEEGTYTLPQTTDAAAIAQNELKAATADVDVTVANKQYVLADGADGVGFYPVKAGTTIKKGKGYLEVTESGAKFYALGGEGTDVRGLIINSLDGTQTIYNLNGQKMEKVQKGVNIVNGHKFIVK